LRGKIGGDWNFRGEFVLELLLFLATFCLFFFLPVNFIIDYRHDRNVRNRLVFELSFFYGWVSRKKEVRIGDAVSAGVPREEEKEGRWFFLKRRTNREIITPFQGGAGGFWEFVARYRHYGLGITFLTYFLPGRYQNWLLVAENLEQQGFFQNFSWETRLGMEDAARTAVAVATIRVIQESLVAYLKSKYPFRRRPTLAVFPDFENAGLETVFNCIFRIKLGYIIIAALVARFRHSWRKGGVGIE
jgi:hypothetical protein